MPVKDSSGDLTAALLLACLPAAAEARQSDGRSSPEIPASVQEAVVESTYHVTQRQDGEWQAANPAQRMHSSFTPGGVRVARGDWSVALALEAWGRRGSLQPPEAAELTAAGSIVEYRRGPLREWYLNEERGLEQGFTVERPPEGDGPLWLVLAIGGGLSAEVLPSGRDALFTDPRGDVVLRYTGLRAWDASGRELAAALAPLDDRIAIEVEDGAAVYPLHIDPWIVFEEARLTASDPGQEDRLGYSVSLWGDTALVGAPKDDHPGSFNGGSAYVFVRSGTTWTEQAKLISSTTESLGYSVSLMGDTAVVGAMSDSHAGGSAAGSALVFVRSGTTWTEQGRLVASDASTFDAFGASVSLSGDVVVVGAPYDVLDDAGSTGSAYVFVRSEAIWIEQAKLTASDPASAGTFGIAVGLDGDTAVIGASQADLAGGLDAGAVYVFVRSGDRWTEQAKLTASDAATSDRFGFSVGLSGGTVLVGAPYDSHAGGSYAGSAYVFVRSGTGWIEEAKLIASDAAATDNFGYSVGLSEDMALMGAPFETHAGKPQAGAAYVFERSETSWTEQTKLVASDAKTLDYLGYAVSLSDDTALAGAIGDQVLGVNGAGSAYVFRFGIYCTPGTSSSGCQAGLSALGTPSASSTTGFELTASNVEGSKDGLFFFGTNGTQALPWGNGTSYQCVVAPVVRAGLLQGSGTPGQCDGSFSQDLNALWCPTCPSPQKNPGAGAIVQAQLWYRDPLSTSNQTTSLSDAIEFCLAP